jgi:hypothetical protein
MHFGTRLPRCESNNDLRLMARLPRVSAGALNAIRPESLSRITDQHTDVSFGGVPCVRLKRTAKLRIPCRLFLTSAKRCSASIVKSSMLSKALRSTALRIPCAKRQTGRPFRSMWLYSSGYPPRKSSHFRWNRECVHSIPPNGSRAEAQKRGSQSNLPRNSTRLRTRVTRARASGFVFDTPASAMPLFRTPTPQPTEPACSASKKF